MKKLLIISLLIMGFYNQLFASESCDTKEVNYGEVKVDERQDALNFLGVLDTAIKKINCAEKPVVLDDLSIPCGTMLATITDKMNKKTALTSDEVEYGHAITYLLINEYLPYSRKSKDADERYIELNTLYKQLHLEGLILKKQELLYQFEKQANSYGSNEIERSPSAKVVNFLWVMLNKQNKLSDFYLPVEEKIVSIDRFCISLYSAILAQKKIDKKEVSYFVSTYTTVLDNSKKSKQQEDARIYLYLLERKHLLDQFKEVNSK